MHYVIGRKPPKSFAKAIIEPSDYEHVISFYNGSVAVIISQDRAGSSNSLTLSWLLIDEAKFIDYERLKDETLPANGGIKSYFGKHSFNHSIMILSDMPQTQKGSWFLHYKEKMDEELIDTIKATIYEIWKTKERVRGRNGFRKDKGGEKLDETEENLLEHRTDGTDAFDTLYIGTEKFPYREIYPITSSGIL